MKVAIVKLAVALGAGMALLGCHDETGFDTPTAVDALVAAAPSLSPSDVLEGLDLGPKQREKVAAMVDELHAAMLEVHESAPADISSMSAEELEAMHDALSSQKDGIHELHDALMAELSEDQRHQFLSRVHAELEEAHDAGSAHFKHGGHGVHH